MRYAALLAPLVLVACGATDPTLIDKMLAGAEQVVPWLGVPALGGLVTQARKMNAERMKPSRAQGEVDALRLELAELRGEVRSLHGAPPNAPTS